MEMDCPKCGAENSESGRYCQNCGAPLVRTEGKSGATSMGLEQNIAGLLCYIAGWVTGLIFILLEKENEFVRFHAMQSIVTFGGLTVVSMALSILSYIPFIGILALVLGWLVGILGVVLWILLMVKAYQGERYKLPWAGDFAERNMPSPGQG